MAGTEASDFVVVGAGIAGASVAYELAAHGRVTLLERESQPGYHTTGRSAALFAETYGNATMRALTRASRAFLSEPPPGFAGTPILSPRGALMVGTAAQIDALERSWAMLHAIAGEAAGLERWRAEQVRERVPAYGADQVAGAIWEPHAKDIDVHALHQGFLRGLRARGGALVCDAGVEALEREHTADGARWRVQTRAGTFVAPVVVNAAGAWADELARLAGAAPIGLAPLRRTAITFDAPAGLAIHGWPAVVDIDEQYYFKPEAGRLLASPADETPSPPCDAQPDEYDIAVLVDKLERATQLRVPRLHAKWAGLRSFVADRTLVTGYDDAASGFFWLAAQGGYGIQTAPAAARAAAALVLGRALPAELQDEGVAVDALVPRREAGAAGDDGAGT